MLHRLPALCFQQLCLEDEETNESPQPFFTFGVIADIQYADKNDAVNHWRTTIRYYRNSYDLLCSAIEKWNSEACPPSFVLQLGDIIDGANVRVKTSENSLEKLLSEIDKCKAPFHHIWGNHEFYNFNRDYLINSKLNTKVLEDVTILDTSSKYCPANSDPMEFYAYHFSPFHNFRIVIVDTYDLSVVGRDQSNPKYLQSVDYILQGDDSENASGLQGHVPIHPGAKRGHCLAWNYKAILSVLHSHKCVVCYIAGHDHSGGYCVDSKGIHHLTLEGIIESPPGSHAFGTVYVYESKMVIEGRGRTASREMPYRTL